MPLISEVGALNEVLDIAPADREMARRRDNEPERSDAGHFRGPRSMYEERGFQPIEVRERDTVMRRSVG